MLHLGGDGDIFEDVRIIQIAVLLDLFTDFIEHPALDGTDFRPQFVLLPVNPLFFFRLIDKKLFVSCRLRQKFLMPAVPLRVFLLHLLPFTALFRLDLLLNADVGVVLLTCLFVIGVGHATLLLACFKHRG